ncbi:MAG TPA: aminotransferase class V-fold PLP-dependent enzyme [Myxococcota bacterium]|nr:aminotransferase class V-fold PLP-dependent enzyme [Myxococcota bacterium]
MPDASARKLARHWTLDPAITYLNHGSFGACPRPVLEAQQALRDQLEREPARFFNREAPALLAAARKELADFVNAPAAGLAFVRNVTVAINSVLRSVPLAAGSELLVTDHEYNATRNILEYAAAERGCRVVVAPVPFPTAGPEAVVEAVLSRVTPRTRLAVIDHVTSQTALVFPIAELVRELQGRGVDVLVDAAHAPGMVDVDIGALAPAYYAANCHKWLCAPKGVGFLWVREDRRRDVRPAVISHGANAPVPVEQRYGVEFFWMGTDDFTPALALPTALRFLAELLPGGVPALRARNRALALGGRRLVADALGVPLPCPDAMIGAMASLPVPALPGLPAAEAVSALVLDPLHDALFHDYGIEVPVLTCPAHEGRLLRISAQAYNEIDDYERLAEALRAIASQ